MCWDMRIKKCIQYIYQKQILEITLNYCCCRIILMAINHGVVNHYIYIKDFNRFMYNKTKHKDKKHFL